MDASGSGSHRQYPHGKTAWTILFLATWTSIRNAKKPRPEYIKTPVLLTEWKKLNLLPYQRFNVRKYTFEAFFVK